MITINSVLKQGKEVEYKKYINTHINNVQKAWILMKGNSNILNYINEVSNNKVTIDIIDSFIDKHDLSKYSEDEFDAYRRKYFPIDKIEEDESEADYKLALQHHYDNNRHHWNYWAERKLINEMPLECVVEMLCDYIAMSMQYGGTALEYYEKNKDKIDIGEKQKQWFIDIATMYYKK